MLAVSLPRVQLVARLWGMYRARTSHRFKSAVSRLQCATSTANSRKAEEVRNCSTDEGRPLGTGLREQVPGAGIASRMYHAFQVASLLPLRSRADASIRFGMNPTLCSISGPFSPIVPFPNRASQNFGGGSGFCVGSKQSSISSAFSSLG